MAVYEDNCSTLASEIKDFDDDKIRCVSKLGLANSLFILHHFS